MTSPEYMLGRGAPQKQPLPGFFEVWSKVIYNGQGYDKGRSRAYIA